MKRWGLFLALATTAVAANAETRRLAIVVGNNAGSAELPPLRYAENDAGKMARVLVELGDVSSEDVMLLQGQPLESVERAITDTRDRVGLLKRSPDIRTVVVFFFSGHSDGEAIELGRERLAYARLKALLSGTGADVRVVIVDACRSGGGLREKGGRAVDPFTIRLADTLQTTGEAFITSSAADESALESSEVMGSFFTHNFISGLRGAADASGDKMVTLAEAYRYAYDRTVSSTAMLPVGAQHPNYDFRLAGQGELVLSTLLRPSSLLVLPEADRVLVTDLSRDQVVVELVGAAREVALAPGQYGIRLFKSGQGLGGRVTLVEGQRHVLALSTLAPVRSSALVAAKGATGVEQQAPATRPEQLALGLSVGATGRVLSPKATALKWQLRAEVEPWTVRLAGTTGVRLTGTLGIAALGEMSFEPAAIGTETPNEGGALVRLGYRLNLEVWRLSLGLGVEVGPAVLAQLYGTRAMTLAFSAAPHLTARLRLGGGVSLMVNGELAFTGLNYGETTQSAQFSWFAFPAVSAGGVYSW